MKRILLIAVMAFSIFIFGCIEYVVTTDWFVDIPFEQGTVGLFLGQEKPYGSVSTYHYGSLFVKLTSSEQVKDVKLLASDVMLRFSKEGLTVKEMEIFLEPFQVDKNNRIYGVINKYSKYVKPSVDKQYSLNWDEFMETVKMSDKIECSIYLKFEANSQIYFIQKFGELKKDVRRDIFWGIYD